MIVKALKEPHTLLATKFTECKKVKNGSNQKGNKSIPYYIEL